MRLSKIFYVLMGVLIGVILVGIFSICEVKAQMGSTFSEEKLTPAVPVVYGNLVAVLNLDMYFQAKDGTVYIVRQRTSKDLDSHVAVIPRS